MAERSWVVAGSWDEDGRAVSEILAEGFTSEEAAEAARNQMRRNAPEIRYEVLSAAYAARWAR